MKVFRFGMIGFAVGLFMAILTGLVFVIFEDALLSGLSNAEQDRLVIPIFTGAALICTVIGLFIGVVKAPKKRKLAIVASILAVILIFVGLAALVYILTINVGIILDLLIKCFTTFGIIGLIIMWLLKSLFTT